MVTCNLSRNQVSTSLSLSLSNLWKNLQDKEVCFKVCYDHNHYEDHVAISLDKLGHFGSNITPLHYACANFVNLYFNSQEQVVAAAYKFKRN